jgi:hypothetical protein
MMSAALDADGRMVGGILQPVGKPGEPAAGDFLRPVGPPGR